MLLLTIALSASVSYGNPVSDDPLEQAIEYLRNQQKEDGSWHAPIGYKINNTYHLAREEAGPHPGVTAIVGLALLEAEWAADDSGDVLESAGNFLTRHQRDDGFISVEGTRMYSHGYATWLLARLAFLDERFAAPRDAAVSLLVQAQNPNGSWSYEPTGEHTVPHLDFVLPERGDAPLTAVQIEALLAARDSGATVPDDTLSRALDYLTQCRVDEEPQLIPTHASMLTGIGTFRYQLGQGSRTTLGTSAAATAALLQARGPSAQTRESCQIVAEGLHGLSNGPLSSHYIFYYSHLHASAALTRAGHDSLDRYIENALPLFLATQLESGAWPNDVGPGPNFATAVGLMVLARLQK